MSTPGGYGGYGQDPNQQYDPLTGQPVQQPGQTAAYPGPDTSAYHGLGQYPQTSAFPSNFPTGGFQQQQPPPRKRTGLIVGIVAAVVVVAVGATLAVVLLNKGDDPQAGGGGTPTTTATTATTAPPTTTHTRTTATTTSGGNGDPLYPGWQTVVTPSGKVRYDVPPDWKLETGDNANLVINAQATMEGVSTFETGACPGHPDSFRAKVGAAPESSDTPQVTAKKVAQDWADGLSSAYKGKTATPTTSEQKINRGSTAATLAVVRVTTKKDDCNPARMLVAVISFQNGSSSESLVLFGDQDVPDAITNEDAAKILATARPAS